MAKNKFQTFAQLAKASQPADLETPKEEIKEVESVTRVGNTVTVNVVDSQGEDLGDVTPAARGMTTTYAHIDEATYRGTSAEEETPVVEDEREGEDTTAGLNDDTEEEEPSGVEEAPALTLNQRNVQTWTTEELEAYITGAVDEEVYYSTVKLAITEHRIREAKLSNAWTIDECKAFLESGIVPATTSKGAWVKDETRKFRREHEWTTQELESWAVGEIQPEGVTLPAGLALELKSRLNLNVPSSDVDAILTNYRHRTGQVDKTVVAPSPTAPTPFVTEAQKAEVTEQIIYEGLSDMNQSYIESSLAEFESIMKPGKQVARKKPTDPHPGGDAQKLLMQVMNYAIRLEDPVACRSAMTLLLNYFSKHRAPGEMFEDTYAFRFIEDMRATTKEQEAHAALLTLFLVYADPMVELRAQTDTGSLIRGVPAKYQSRVFEFFGKL